MTLLKELKYDDIDFHVVGSQQFATVLFDRTEDSNDSLITVILSDGTIHKERGNNKYNPSLRRHSSCVYVCEEGDEKIIKICTIQHKGHTLIEIHSVSHEEFCYIFGRIGGIF